MVQKKLSPIKKASLGVVNFVNNIQIFESLNSNEVSTMVKHMYFGKFEPGETVFCEGAVGKYVCFVVFGSLDVLKRNRVGEEVSIAVLHKGGSIGEMAIIDKSPRSATVKARTKATLLFIGRNEFDEILRRFPAIGIKILKGLSRLLSQNLRKTSTRLADYMLPLS